MSLNTNALITLEDIKNYLGINNTDDDTLLESLINGVSEFVENYIGYPVKEASYTETCKGFEIMNLGWQYFLKRLRVQSLAYVKKNDETLTEDTDFLVIRSQARVVFSEDLSIEEEDIFEFSYTAGFSTVPSDLQMICKQLVAMFYRHRDLSITSTNTQGVAKSIDPSKIPSFVIKTLEAYKKVGVL